MRGFFHLQLIIIASLLTACSRYDQPEFGSLAEVTIATTGSITGPRFSQDAAGGLVLSWMESQESGTALQYAQLTNGSFGAPRHVVTDPDMFVNWADLPSVMRVKAGHYIAHWLRYSADETYAYDVVVSQSVDAGKTWSEAVAVHNDGTTTEHGFVSMHRQVDGVSLLWLDGRDTSKEPGDNVLDTSMTLRSAVLTPDGRVTRDQLVDASVCDCCQTDVAISSKGPIAVYRDRTVEEIRDIYVTRFTEGRWQPGTRLHEDNWIIAGCPVNGPAIVARDNLVAVAWFSAAENHPVVRVVASHDGGTTFGKPVVVATGRLAGNVGLALLDNASIVASWVGRNESGGNTLHMRRIAVEGQLSPTRDIAHISQLRVLPQLAYAEDNLYVAWTDESDIGRHLQVVRIPVSAP